MEPGPSGKVVAVHTGGRWSVEVLDTAAREARLRGAQLSVLSVFRGLPRGEPGRRRGDAVVHDGGARELSLRRAGVQVMVARRALTRRWPDVPVSATVLDASRPGGVEELLAGGVLLVLRTRPSFSGDRRRGDPLRALVRASEIPTLLVPGAATATTSDADPGPVVVGVSAAGLDPALLRTAARTAQDHGRGLRLVHVLSGGDVSPAALLRVRRHMAEAGAYLGHALRVESLLGPGDPAAVLVDAAQQASLLVLGGGTRQLVEGDGTGTSARVVAAAACPVLVVPRLSVRPEHPPAAPPAPPAARRPMTTPPRRSRPGLERPGPPSRR